jgi:hypothetical protein
VPTRKTTSTKPAAKSKTTKKAAPKRASAKTTSTRSAAKEAKKKAPAKRKTKAAAVSDQEVAIDRRRSDRRGDEQSNATEPKLERRKKVARRRQIDPTTCERDYSDQEVEFMNALDDYKRKNGRMFPTCSEVLEVIRSLGYVQLSSAELAANASAENDPDLAMEPSYDDAEMEAELVG